MSANPLAPYRLLLKYFCNADTQTLQDNLTTGQKGSYIIGGMITNVFEGRTKNGNLYGRLTIEDYEGNYELAIFGDKYLEQKSFINKDSLVLIYGDIESRPFRQDDLEFVIKRITQMTETMQEQALQTLQIGIPVDVLNETSMYDLSTFLENNRGESKLYIRLLDPQGVLNSTLEYTKHGIKPSSALLEYCDQNGYELKAK